jgi:hypothetical protein
MYARSFRKADQVRRFTITDTRSAGWEVREEENSRVIRSARYTDWHRVERARMAFAREALSLEDAGWTETV